MQSDVRIDAILAHDLFGVASVGLKSLGGMVVVFLVGKMVNVKVKTERRMNTKQVLLQ